MTGVIYNINDLAFEGTRALPKAKSFHYAVTTCSLAAR
jgi:hypothetical protein